MYAIEHRSIDHFNDVVTHTNEHYASTLQKARQWILTQGIHLRNDNTHHSMYALVKPTIDIDDFIDPAYNDMFYMDLNGNVYLHNLLYIAESDIPTRVELYGVIHAINMSPITNDTLRSLFSTINVYFGGELAPDTQNNNLLRVDGLVICDDDDAPELTLASFLEKLKSIGYIYVPASRTAQSKIHDDNQNANTQEPVIHVEDVTFMLEPIRRHNHTCETCTYLTSTSTRNPEHEQIDVYACNGSAILRYGDYPMQYSAFTYHELTNDIPYRDLLHRAKLFKSNIQGM